MMRSTRRSLRTWRRSVLNTEKSSEFHIYRARRGIHTALSYLQAAGSLAAYVTIGFLKQFALRYLRFALMRLPGNIPAFFTNAQLVCSTGMLRSLGRKKGKRWSESERSLWSSRTSQGRRKAGMRWPEESSAARPSRLNSTRWIFSR